jgi:hypothetical protein
MTRGQHPERPSASTLRVVDANLNRAREGLRVVEDVARFVLGDEALTKRAKDLRHALSGYIRRAGFDEDRLLSARDAGHDVARVSPRPTTARAGGASSTPPPDVRPKPCGAWKSAANSSARPTPRQKSSVHAT